MIFLSTKFEKKRKVYRDNIVFKDSMVPLDEPTLPKQSFALNSKFNSKINEPKF